MHPPLPRFPHEFSRLQRMVEVKKHAPASSACTLRGHEREVLSVAFSPDGRRIVSGSWEMTLKVWDAAASE